MSVEAHGAADAAAVLLALDPATATQVLKHLSTDDVKRLTSLARDVEETDVDELQSTLRRFESLMREPMPVLLARASDNIRGMAEQALGPMFGQEEKKVVEVGPDPLARLERGDARTLATLLRDEHPQLAASIIAQLTVSKAKQVLDHFDTAVQNDLLGRISNLSRMKKPLVAEATEALARSIEEADAIEAEPDADSFNGVGFAADLLKQLPADRSEEMLGEIERRSEENARKVREAMFGFDDLAELPPRAMQLVMKEISSDMLLPALKTASPELVDLFLSAVSSRAAKTMREDLELLRPMRLSEVEEAQRGIAEVALKLADDGHIVLPMGGGEEMV